MSIDKKSKSDHVSENQKELILAFMKDDLQFAAGKYDRNFTHMRAQIKWKELSNILNTFPGPKKDWKSWKRTWQDIKSKTKLKYMKQEQNGEIYIPLTKFQHNVMKLIKLFEELYGNCDKDDWLDDINFEEKYAEKTNATNDYIEENDHDYMEEKILRPHKRMKREINEKLEAKEEIKIIFTKQDEAEEYNLEYGGFKSLKPTTQSVYYEKKLAILDRIAVAKEKSAEAKQGIAFELKNITSLLVGYIDK